MRNNFRARGRHNRGITLDMIMVFVRVNNVFYGVTLLFSQGHHRITIQRIQSNGLSSFFTTNQVIEIT